MTAKKLLAIALAGNIILSGFTLEAGKSKKEEQANPVKETKPEKKKKPEKKEKEAKVTEAELKIALTTAEKTVKKLAKAKKEHSGFASEVVLIALGEEDSYDEIFKTLLGVHLHMFNWHTFVGIMKGLAKDALPSYAKHQTNETELGKIKKLQKMLDKHINNAEELKAFKKVWLDTLLGAAFLEEYTENA